MIDSYIATYILVGFLVIFGMLLPIIEKLPKIRNVVSLRWTLVVIYSAMCLGVILDFSHLDTSVRLAVIVGGILLSAIFVIVRSVEKFTYYHWKFPHTEAKVSHKDTKAEICIIPDSEDEKPVTITTKEDDSNNPKIEVKENT